MTKRPSLFTGKKSPADEVSDHRAQVQHAQDAMERIEAPTTSQGLHEAISAPKYPKASTREGKRVVTAYLDPEAFRQLKRIAADEDRQQQDLLLEGINAVFEKRGLSRIA